MEDQNNNTKIYLFGASGHGKVIKDIIENNNKKIEAFFDDNPKKSELTELKVYSFNKLNKHLKDDFIISIGDNVIRKKISIKLNVNFVKAIHKTAIISNSVKIEHGSVVMAGAIINTEAIVGKHCILNTNSVVEHHCVLKDFVHISPSATIAGSVIIGEGTHVGTGAVVLPNLKIGKWAIIGAGAVVVNSIPDYAVVVGNPGRIIKYKKNE